MEHPKFYNVRVDANGDNFGCTHMEDEPVKIIVSLPNDDEEANPVINHTVAELVELIANSQKKK